MDSETKLRVLIKEEHPKHASDFEQEGGQKKKSRIDDAMEFECLQEPKEYPLEKSYGKNGVAVSQCREHRKILDKALSSSQYKVFWSEARKEEWIQETSNELRKNFPEIHIGVLGTTGTGKSSLLNALLGETILPTSGSRACTAAPVQVRYNKDLLSPSDQTCIYKACIELLPLDVWHDELELLLDDCCGDEGTVEPRKSRGDKRAAWDKVDQVYGSGTMKKFEGMSKSDAFEKLREDARVVKLLSGGRIEIMEGPVNQAETEMLLGPSLDWTDELEEKHEASRDQFRDKLNAFVYRNPGDGDGLAQNWPLVRKATIYGPWEVLSTGACLEDLPGVCDANASRAKVAEDCIQNCHQIWIVASIKRAVDDGIARDLLGDQFKRLLLMDGQYGKVSFICTQTDNCEAVEIMRDHGDVARRIEGRWEKMEELQSQIEDTKRELNSLSAKKRLEKQIKVATKAVNDAEREIKKHRKAIGASKTQSSSDGESDPNQILKDLESILEDKKQELSSSEAALAEQKVKRPKLEEKSRLLQIDLQALAAIVRNEYSTERLQADFRSGYKELTVGDEVTDETDAAPQDSNTLDPLLDDSNIDVFCVSSNDFMKIVTGGQPTPFANPDDTQIPSLRKWVHNYTNASFRSFSEDQVKKTSNYIDRVLLCVSSYEERSCGKRFHEAFEKEMEKLLSSMTAIVQRFREKVQSEIDSTLRPSLQAGARKAKAKAVKTAASWGPRSRQSFDAEEPDCSKSLFWTTYAAVLKRKGNFESCTAGSISFNVDLYAPMLKEYSFSWTKITTRTMNKFLDEFKDDAEQCWTVYSDKIFQAFGSLGMKQDRLDSMRQATNDYCLSNLKDALDIMKEAAVKVQKNIHRRPLEIICDNMRPGYIAAAQVERGPGTFARMNKKLLEHTKEAARSMFDDAVEDTLQELDGLLDELTSSMDDAAQEISENSSAVCSVCWDDDQKEDVMDPAIKRKISIAHRKLVQDLDRLCQDQKKCAEIIDLTGED